MCVSQGVVSVVNYVQKKHSHPRVIWVNLRDDVTVQCDLVTYSVRDIAALEEPVLLPAATRGAIEVLRSLPVTWHAKTPFGLWNILVIARSFFASVVWIIRSHRVHVVNEMRPVAMAKFTPLTNWQTDFCHVSTTLNRVPNTSLLRSEDCRIKAAEGPGGCSVSVHILNKIGQIVLQL